MVDLNQACVRHVQLMRLSDKQKRVLIASLTLFSEIGFEKTTSLDISRRAEVSEGTVLAILKQKKAYSIRFFSCFLIRSYLKQLNCLLIKSSV